MSRTAVLMLCLPCLASAEGPDGEAASAIRELGGLVMPIAQSDERLDVSLHLADGEIGDDAVGLVSRLDNVAWLNLAGTAVGDEGVKRLAGMKSLERLHLERTKVTDASAEPLAELPKLTYLNLYGTALTDAGLETLTKSKSLRKLFVWQTKVTSDAAKAASGESLSVVGEVALPTPEAPAAKSEEKPESDAGGPAAKPEAKGEKSQPAADPPLKPDAKSDDGRANPQAADGDSRD